MQPIYEAAFSEDPNALAALLAPIANARSTLVHSLGPSGDVQPISTSYFSIEIVRGFQAFAHLDPWTIASIDMRPGEAVRLTDMVSTAAFQRSAFYNDFVRPVGDDTSYCLAALFPLGETTGVLAFHRGAGQADFSSDEQKRLDQSLPHIRTLLQVRGRLTLAERRATHLEATVRSWTRAVAHVNQRGMLVFANNAATEIFAKSETFDLTRSGWLRVRGRLGAVFEQAIANALSAGVGAALSLPRATGGSYQVTVAPLFSAETQSTVALVSIVDPDLVEQPPVAELMAFFDLTRTQAELAAALTAGRSLDEISEARNIQVGTARTHLKHILQKTGTRRQAELVAMLKSVPRLPR